MTRPAVEERYLLDSQQMARFVARGFLRFDELVPQELNRMVMAEIDAGTIEGAPAGTPLSQCYQGSAIRKVLDLPEIQGIVHSLVGPDPLFDHDAVHVREPNQGEAQGMHADSIIDTRMAFDVQLMYYPHDVPLEMGGTLLLPGSHFRRVNEMDIARYQNLQGQIPMVCKAGSILVLHHGIWHCGRRNRTDRRRYMFKVRLNPQVRQLRLWNTRDLVEGYDAPQEIFAGQGDEDDIQTILSRQEPWFEAAAGRLEIINRVRLWRFLTGDDSFDAHYWLTRLENVPVATL
ncbi:MAG: phytanoyl-CoA dioxygenase family protein [Trueperaceae bacterium]|nr:MAG: phytanoyl-CoA dioxygenase family protein [Trueperaceae bacterium]